MIQNISFMQSYQNISQAHNYQNISSDEMIEINLDKTDKTAIELLANAHLTYQERLLLKQEICNGFRLLSGVVHGINQIFFPIILTSNQLHYLTSNVAIMILSGVSLATTVSYYQYFEGKRFKLKNHFEAVNNFYDKFQNFKVDPQNLNVSSLFHLFEKMKTDWAYCALNDKLINQEDFDLYGATGKLFLIDEICSIFKEKNISSSLVKKWDDINSSKIADLKPDFLQELQPEIGTIHENANDFLNFHQKKQFLESVDILETIVTIFKNTIDKAIETGDI